MEKQESVSDMRHSNQVGKIVVFGILICCFIYANCNHMFATENFLTEKTDAKRSNGTIVELLQKQEGKEPSNETQVPSINARSAALLDASNGRVLYSKNGTTQMAMASTTKIMTCIVVLEHMKNHDVVQISANAARQPDVQLHVLEGEQFEVKDLLYALMLESCNDVAVALAEHIGGSVEEFAQMMNQKAEELGCRQTHFVTPNGLDAGEHYSTAEDLCRIGAYAIKNPEFLKITQAESYRFAEKKSGKQYSVTNKDAFLHMYQGAIGIKTGFTGNAGYCFVGAAKRGENCLVSAVLAAGWPPHKTYKWSDTKSIMDYGFQNFQSMVLFRKKFSIKPIEVWKGTKLNVPVATKQVKMTMLADHTEQTAVLYEHPYTVAAPVSKGDVLGTVYYVVDEHVYRKEDAYSKETVGKYTYGFIAGQLAKVWAFF